jgi:hypothetical protein
MSSIPTKATGACGKTPSQLACGKSPIKLALLAALKKSGGVCSIGDLMGLTSTADTPRKRIAIGTSLREMVSRGLITRPGKAGGYLIVDDYIPPPPEPPPPPLAPDDPLLAAGTRLAIEYSPQAGCSTYVGFAEVGPIELKPDKDNNRCFRLFPVGTTSKESVQNTDHWSSTTEIVPDWSHVGRTGYIVKLVPAKGTRSGIEYPPFIWTPSVKTTSTTYTLYDETVTYTNFNDHGD